MKITIVGGGGFIGGKLARALAARGTLRDKPITQLILADLAAPAPIEAAFPVGTVAVDISKTGSLAEAIPDGTDVVFHLAAIVSAQAEAEFDTGMAVNLMGTLNLLERCRELPTPPVVVYTSSIAAFGGEVPDPIRDWTLPNPQTSYGAQKVAGELMLTDYSRKGFIDGRGFRLPTISVRPGRPNRAASSFMSSIIREPLNGEPAVCPVDPDFAHFYLSPRRCVQNLILGAELETEALGQNRVMTMPGRTWTIAQLLAAMTAVAGDGPAQLVRWERQPEIEAVVLGWRAHFETDKALRLGLRADDSFEDNVRFYLEDDAPRP